jgi:hypothetical protein
VEDAAAADRGDVAGEGRVLDQRVAVGKAEEAAAVPGFLDVAVLRDGGHARDVLHEERPADDEIVVRGIGKPAAVLSAVALDRRIEDEERVA